jgi:hypothetical protein
MTVALGVMQVPAPQDGDSIRRYETGTLPDGGLWTALTRVSNHDHTGGLNGAPISVSSIPDGSITTAKLDPSVLAPYALVDGSKAFTGQVAMNADAIVRDHLYFGAKPAGAADVTLQRTGAGALRVDTNLGVGVNPAATPAGNPSVRLGTGFAMLGDGALAAYLTSNSYFATATGWTALTTGAGVRLTMNGGGADLSTAPSAAAGAAQTFTTRAQIAQTGTLTLSPDAGQAAVNVQNATPVVFYDGAGASSIRHSNTAVSGGGMVFQWGGSDKLGLLSNALAPTVSGGLYCGTSATPWQTVYAVTGTIQPSSREAKEAITPLDPAQAMAAVRNTQPVTFDYKPPERGAEWYDLPDDPEQAEAVLLQRLTAAPLEAGARHQAGFVLGSPEYPTDPLFETGEGQSNAANTCGVLLAALRDLDARLAALETP